MIPERADQFSGMTVLVDEMPVTLIRSALPNLCLTVIAWKERSQGRHSNALPASGA